MILTQLPPSCNWYFPHIADWNLRELVAYGSRDYVVVLEVDSIRGKITLAATLVGHKDRVCCVVFLDLGIVSASLDKTVRIWDSTTFQCTHILRGYHNVEITALAANDTTLISGDKKGTLCLWKLQPPHACDLITPFASPPYSSVTCISVFKKYFVVGFQNGLVCVYDDSHLRFKASFHTDQIFHISVSYHEDVFLSSGKDRKVLLWALKSSTQDQVDFETPKEVVPRKKAHTPKKQPTPLGHTWNRVTPSTFLLSYSNGDIFYVSTTPQITHRKLPNPYRRAIFQVLFLSPQSFLTLSVDRRFVCWSLSGKVRWNLPTLGGKIYMICQSPIHPQKIAFGDSENLLRVWNTTLPLPQQQNQSHTNHTEKKAILKGEDCLVLWRGLLDKITAVSWHPTHESIIVFGLSDGRYGFTDVSCANPTHQFFTPKHRGTIYSLIWREINDEDVFLYSVALNELFLSFPTSPATPSVDLSTNIRTLLSPDDLQANITEAAWNDKGTFLCVGFSTGLLFLLEEITPRDNKFRIVYQVKQHSKAINRIKWRGDTVASAGDDGKIIVVSSLSYKTVSLPSGGRLFDLAWNPSKKNQLIAVSEKGMAFLWDVESCHMINKITKPFEGRLTSVPLRAVCWSWIEPGIVFLGGDYPCVVKLDVSLPGRLSDESNQPNPKVWKCQEEPIKESSSGSIQKKKTKEKKTKKKPQTCLTQIGEALVVHRKQHGVLVGDSDFHTFRLFIQSLYPGGLLCDNFFEVEIPTLPVVCFPFFMGRKAICRHILQEKQIHLSNQNYFMAAIIELWQGNIDQSLEYFGYLEDEPSIHMNLAPKHLFRLFISPIFGRTAWSEAIRHYADTHESLSPHLAAFFHLLLHDVPKAIQVYTTHHLYLDALSLAALRLPSPSIPVLYSSWSSYLKTQNLFVLSALAQLVAGRPDTAGDILYSANNMNLPSYCMGLSGAYEISLCLHQNEKAKSIALALACLKDNDQAKEWASRSTLPQLRYLVNTHLEIGNKPLHTEQFSPRVTPAMLHTIRTSPPESFALLNFPPSLFKLVWGTFTSRFLINTEIALAAGQILDEPFETAAPHILSIFLRLWEGGDILLFQKVCSSFFPFPHKVSNPTLFFWVTYSRLLSLWYRPQPPRDFIQQLIVSIITGDEDERDHLLSSIVDIFFHSRDVFPNLPQVLCFEFAMILSSLLPSMKQQIHIFSLEHLSLSESQIGQMESLCT